MQLTCVEVAPLSFKLDFAPISWTTSRKLVNLIIRTLLITNKLAISSTGRELHKYLRGASMLTCSLCSQSGSKSTFIVAN